VIDVLAQLCADVANVLRHWGTDAVGVAVAKAVDDGSVILSRGAVRRGSVSMTRDNEAPSTTTDTSQRVRRETTRSGDPSENRRQPRIDVIGDYISARWRRGGPSVDLGSNTFGVGISQPEKDRDLPLLTWNILRQNAIHVVGPILAP
jgi:hypothetical protein